MSKPQPTPQSEGESNQISSQFNQSLNHRHTQKGLDSTNHIKHGFLMASKDRLRETFHVPTSGHGIGPNSHYQLSDIILHVVAYIS